MAAVWRNTSRSFPTKEGNYDCVVECDFCGQHRVRRQIILWAQGHWCGLTRDGDTVTYWRELSENPTGKRCQSCGWPVEFCRCSQASGYFL